MNAFVASELIDEARAAAGLDDFGSNHFREGLDVYCDSVGREADLNEIGIAAVHGNVAGNLANRLRVVDYAKRHPDIVQERVDAPLVVIGMFRAGTTFLSYLLEQDPQNRALLRWEAGDSVPPPTPADFRAGPRVEAARAGNDMLEQINPALRAIHHEEPDGPTECITLMSQDFKSLSWEAISNVPTYGRWLLGADHTSAYEYHRLALQVLQHGGVRGRWTLKSPHHAIALDALTAVYPDARLVLVHRDPVVLCASVCSLIATLSGTFSDADHRTYIADHWVAMLDESIVRIDRFRAAHPDHPIVDVQYDDLVRAPVETVASIYAAFDGPVLDDAARRAMEAYVAAHPKDALGVHRYDLAAYGLDAGAISERFAGYVARYGVPTASTR
ncbi:MAG TPA: sulfotransferase [Acidimicrobiia bacterium]|nr:sulfotransferase [Acidimicrobiia bacterium]